MSRARKTVVEIKSAFKKEGYILLTTEYKNNKQKLSCICPNQHNWNVTWANWITGYRCKKCFDENVRSQSKKLTIEFVRSEFEKENYQLLSLKYINANKKLDCVCPNGHKYKVRWGDWQQGKRCPCHTNNIKPKIKQIKDNFAIDGYSLLTDSYINNESILECVCPNGHIYKVSWGNWNSKGYRCPKCSMVGVSKQELYLTNFIKSIYDEVIEHDRQLISPYELDIVIPDKKIAIEYCGLYWHSELAGKDRKYHLRKLEMCKEKGYRLITIFEDELVNCKSVVFSVLKNLLSVDKLCVICARKCIIKEIKTIEAKMFCNTNHLQGYGPSIVKLGAFYNDELVSVMAFSKPSIAKGQKEKKDGVWELNRFCSKMDYRVIGAASKLLKYFERNYEWNKIFSYADRRWFEGKLYKQMGFSFVNTTQPNYWYFKEQKRIHRFALRKTKDDPKNITEWEIRKSQGWNRIWDCGNLKYEMIRPRHN